MYPRVQLRPLRMSDLPAVLKWSRDHQFCRANEWDVDLPADRIQRWLDRSVTGEPSDLVRFGVELDQTLVGYVDLANVSSTSAEFGIAVGDSSRWGQGIGTAAGRALLDHAFDTLRLRRINAVVSAANSRSLRLMTRLGFIRSSQVPAAEPVHGVSLPELTFELDDCHYRRCVPGEQVDLWVRPMTIEDAEVVAAWRYRDDLSIYNLPSAQPLRDNLASYFAVLAGNTLVGFCCIGVEARIPGMAEQLDVLDIGLGMDPALVGRGTGTRFAETIIGYLTARYPGDTLRAVVQSWNKRSLRLTRRLGFEDVGELTTVQNAQPVSYRVVMTRAKQAEI